MPLPSTANSAAVSPDDAQKLTFPNQFLLCPLCSKPFSRPDSLKRHFRSVHPSRDNQAPAEEQLMDQDQPRDQDQTRDQDQQRDQDQPNVTIIRYFRPEPMNAAEVEAYQAFKQFMLSVKGGASSKATTVGYAGKMRNFLQHGRHNRGIPDASFRALATVGTAQSFVPPPELEPFLPVCSSNWVRKYTVCAYIKLLRWLKDDLLCSAMLVLPAEDYNRRNWCLDSLLNSSAMILRALNKAGGRAANGTTSRASANAVDSPTLAELEALIVAYKTSTARQSMVDASQNLEAYLKQGVIIWERRERSPFFLRNFLMLELLIGNGSRPGAIYNATLHEFQASQPLRDGSGFFMSVSQHKTSKTSGNDTLIMKAWLFQAVKQFALHARYMVMSGAQDFEDGTLALFPSCRRPANAEAPHRRGFKQCLEVFFELANKMIDPRICATSFRSLHASLGQISEDPAVRAELPALMGHNLKTAVSTYFRDEAKATRRSAFQQSILNEAGATTPPRGDTSE